MSMCARPTASIPVKADLDKNRVRITSDLLISVEINSPLYYALVSFLVLVVFRAGGGGGGGLEFNVFQVRYNKET